MICTQSVERRNSSVDKPCSVARPAHVVGQTHALPRTAATSHGLVHILQGMTVASVTVASVSHDTGVAVIPRFIGPGCTGLCHLAPFHPIIHLLPSLAAHSLRLQVFV